MAYIYAMSDIHGEIAILKEMLDLVDLDNKENQLILLGDYIDHAAHNYDALAFVKALQAQHQNVVVLLGNHEFMLLEEI